MEPRTYTFTAGALVRKQMRRWLVELDLPYTEIKSLFESSFVVKATEDRHRENVIILRNHILYVKRMQNK